MCASSGRRSKPIPSARNSSSRKPGSATGCAPRIKSPTAVPDEISMLLTMRSAGATMKIADLLSPADVMIDVRASNKRLLLQELAAKAAASLGLAGAPGPPLPSQAGRPGVDGNRPWRRHSPCPAAGSAAALRVAGETEEPDRIRRHRRATGGHRICSVAASFGREWANRGAGAGGPDVATAGESRPIARRKEFVRALFGGRLTAGNLKSRSAARNPKREPSPSAKIIFPQPGEKSWHGNIQRKHLPRSDAR